MTMSSLMSQPSRLRSSRAFTLVELLAVIVIVGLLSALTVGAVGQVREKARAAACQGNLRQIGAAFSLYAAENRGLLPMPQEQNQIWPMNTWMHKLQPHLEQRQVRTNAENLSLAFDGVFRCPGKSDWDLSASHDAYKISYGMNCFDATNAGESAKYEARRVQTLAHPAITMLAMDRGMFNASGQPVSMGPYILNKNHVYRDALGLWHNGKDNVLFVDGHVEALPKNGLNYYLMKTDNGALRPW